MKSRSRLMVGWLAAMVTWGATTAVASSMISTVGDIVGEAEGVPGRVAVAARFDPAGVVPGWVGLAASWVGCSELGGALVTAGGGGRVAGFWESWMTEQAVRRKRAMKIMVVERENLFSCVFIIIQ